MRALVSRKRMEQTILVVRGHRVMLDTDLADLYGVTTKRLNEQVKRNRNRFPADFMFQLTSQEKAEVVAHCDHLKKIKFSPVRPAAFTEHGAMGEAMMAAGLSGFFCFSSHTNHITKQTKQTQ